MPNATASPNVQARVESLINALEAMIQTLDEEHQALNNADAPALTDIATRKAQAVETISRGYDAFKQELGLNSEGLSQEASSHMFKVALNAIRVTMPQLSERLDQLVRLTRACRQSNQDNGTLVNLGLQNCQSSLGLLQRLNQPAQAGTYGPGAQPQDHFDSLQRLQLRA